MSSYWLIAAFLGFILAFATLMVISFRERKRIKSTAAGTMNQASDKRLALMILFALITGAALALFVGYVVFFSGLK